MQTLLLDAEKSDTPAPAPGPRGCQCIECRALPYLAREAPPDAVEPELRRLRDRLFAIGADAAGLAVSQALLELRRLRVAA